MSKMAEINKRLQQLPEQRRRKRLSSKMATLTERINNAHAKLLSADKKRKCAIILFPENSFPTTTTKLSNAAKFAAQIKEALVTDLSAVSDEQIEKKVTRIGECADQAVAEINKNWESLLRKRFEPYEALTGVATSLNLPGCSDMTAIMKRLQRCADAPPAEKKEAERIKNDLENLVTSVENLGLKGPAGEFLVKAVRGAADPRDLYKKEVRDFFDGKKLWNLLVVKTK